MQKVQEKYNTYEIKFINKTAKSVDNSFKVISSAS